MVVNSSLSCKPNYLLINYTSRANEFTQNVNQRELSANFETIGVLGEIRPNLKRGFKNYSLGEIPSDHIGEEPKQKISLQFQLRRL